MPKVSVIVPIYNVEQYLEKCIKSLVIQTLKELQIILVNDGSTDGSEKIIKAYLEKYPNRFIYVRKENGGLSDARNFGMKYATGEYIAFLDADDYIEKDMYETMYQKAKQDNSDLVECDFIWEYSNNSRIDKGELYYGPKEMIVKARVVAWNKLIRRELLEERKHHYTVGVRYEDIDFFYNMVPYYKKVSFVKRPFVHYVQRENSISNIQNEKTKDIFTVLDNVILFYKKQRLFEIYQEELEYVYVKDLLCSSLLRIVKILDKKTRKDLLQQTWKKINDTFPNWKKNIYFRKEFSFKKLYLCQINKITYPIFCFIIGKILRKGK